MTQTPITVESSVLILEVERQRTLKSDSRRASVLWGATTVLVVLIGLFVYGLPVVDPTRRILAGSLMALVAAGSRCLTHFRRFQRASRDLSVYEAAYQAELAGVPALSVLRNHD